MKLIPSPLLLFNKHIWPSCNKPKTLSFRASPSDTMFKTVNSVYFDPKYTQTNDVEEEMTTPDSWFTNSSESASISTESEEYLNPNEDSSVETIVRGARSERLLFKPGPTTSSILEGKKQCMDLKLIGSGGEDETKDPNEANVDIPYKESVVMAIESNDPHGDFKKSMEEMVESHGLKDWECLEELLGWYLRMNGKNHHELIVGAFVDLLAGISGGSSRGNDGTGDGGGGSSSDQSIASFTSVASTFTSPVSSKGGGGEREIIEEEILLANH